MIRYKNLIIIMLCLLTTNMSGQPFKLTKCNYNGLYEQMFRYIYIIESGCFDSVKDEDPYNYKYVVIKDMISGDEVLNDDKMPDNGVLGCTPTTMHPAHTSLILKSGCDCEIIYSYFEYQTLDSSYILYQQLSQAYEFFQSHQSQMDADDFPAYAKIICDVFVENSKYLE